MLQFISWAMWACYLTFLKPQSILYGRFPQWPLRYDIRLSKYFPEVLFIYHRYTCGAPWLISLSAWLSDLTVPIWSSQCLWARGGWLVAPSQSHLCVQPLYPVVGLEGDIRLHCWSLGVWGNVQRWNVHTHRKFSATQTHLHLLTCEWHAYWC